MIFVGVGTYIHGFDELVEAADRAAAGLGRPGFAQLGHSRYQPCHLAWTRFLDPPELADRLRAADVVVCHGGLGLLGDALRAGRPIIAVPRRGRPTREAPAGDQAALVERLAELYPIRVCREPESLRPILAEVLAAGSPGPVSYDLAGGSGVPELLARHLAGLEDRQSRPTRSS